jgi:hypothetical protein
MKWRKKLILLILLTACTGCTPAPTVTGMVSPVLLPAPKISEKTLLVSEVRGGDITQPWSLKSKIERAGFQQALIVTLKQSGLFKRIYTEGSGDYQLDTEIISQDIMLGVPDIVATLFVHYELTKIKSQKKVWTESILSQYREASFGFPGESQRKANEGVVRENLSQLLKKLAAHLKDP